MRKIKFIWLFLGLVANLKLSQTLSAQDTMYKKDGSKLAVKVLVVSEFDVTYLLYENLTNTYKNRILRSSILYIRYENNLIDTFSQETVNKLPEPKVDVLKKNFGRNRLSFYLSDPLVNMLSFQFERLHKKGHFGLAIPISSSLTELGLKSDDRKYKPTSLDYYNIAKLFNTGLQINYYPFGQGTFAYWTGVFSEYGFNKNIKFYTILFQNGIIYHPHKHLHLSFASSYGGIQSTYNGNRTFAGSTFRFSFLLGYTFK